MRGLGNFLTVKFIYCYFKDGDRVEGDFLVTVDLGEGDFFVTVNSGEGDFFVYVDLGEGNFYWCGGVFGDGSLIF